MRFLHFLAFLMVLGLGLPAQAQTAKRLPSYTAAPKPTRAAIKASRLELRTNGNLEDLASRTSETVLAWKKSKKEGRKELSAKIDAVVSDPDTLKALGLFAREKGNLQLAGAYFDRSIAKEELSLYERYTGSLAAKALRQEFLGENDEAETTWNTAIKRDLLGAYFHLVRSSHHARREVLLDQARTLLIEQLQAVEAGSGGTIYSTRKGPKPLTLMTNEAAIAAFRRGEALRHVYIPTLDLSGQTFDEPIACQRCVVGSLKGFNATFKNGFSFRGIVLGDLHLGKSWTGKVNRSRSVPAATFNKLLLDKVLVFGKLNLDSIEVKTNTASMPFVVVEGEAILKNAQLSAGLDMRYSVFQRGLSLKGATLTGAAYLGHIQASGVDLTRLRANQDAVFMDSGLFWGPVQGARCEFSQNLTFENSVFLEPLELHHCRVGKKLNLSRTRMVKGANLEYVELNDVEAYGIQSMGPFVLSDSIVHGNARFALDGLNRRLHLEDPHPTHRLYKSYQGDVDSDDELSTMSHYGVTHVDDLAAQFNNDTSFANTIFEKFVGFEGVVFGTPKGDHHARFFNTQLYGEAHFERTRFYALADFRTISGNELSFNNARIERSWLLDDANIPGRLSVAGLRFGPTASVSFYGARMAYFGATFDQIHTDKRSRLFYEACAASDSPPASDPRLLAARWDLDQEKERTNADEISTLAHEICLDRTIGEFVVLRDSFNKRGMTIESDWAYWNLRHYTSIRDREKAEGVFEVAFAWANWALFENAFGWGVRLGNLFWSSLVVVLLYMFLIRLLCGHMLVDWDSRTMKLSEMPIYALFIISLHSFLGRARDWKTKTSNNTWKVLYTSEMIIGIILITFFIGAYARIILR